MRGVIIVAAALTAMSATGASAQEWCGYAGARSMIECGYSSLEGCESIIGKGAMCFINPDYALNATRAKRLFAVKNPPVRG
jgi:hypothetical protein